jgi:hypothetical protein
MCPTRSGADDLASIRRSSTTCAGSTPPDKQPVWLRFSNESVWPNFRFGTKPGEPFADSQFPLTAVDELAKQGVSDVSFGGVPTPTPR